MPLHYDTYYRGYRLAQFSDGAVAVFQGTQFIEEVPSLDQAKNDIDSWQNAR